MTRLKTLSQKIVHKSKSKKKSNPYFNNNKNKNNKRPVNNYNSRGEVGETHWPSMCS
jgi:hypothetical protein